MVLVVGERGGSGRFAVEGGVGWEASWWRSEGDGVVCEMEGGEVRWRVVEVERVAGCGAHGGVAGLEPFERDERKPAFRGGEVFRALRAEVGDLLEVIRFSRLSEGSCSEHEEHQEFFHGLGAYLWMRAGSGEDVDGVEPGFDERWPVRDGECGGSESVAVAAFGVDVEFCGDLELLEGLCVEEDVFYMNRIVLGLEQERGRSGGARVDAFGQLSECGGLGEICGVDTDD